MIIHNYLNELWVDVPVVRGTQISSYGRVKRLVFLNNVSYLRSLNKTFQVMTEEQKNALRENLYNRSIRELVEIIISQQDELQEAKDIRSRLMKIRNLALEPAERRAPGRPKKG